LGLLHLRVLQVDRRWKLAKVPGDDYVVQVGHCSSSREGAAWAQAGIVPLFERSLGSDE